MGKTRWEQEGRSFKKKTKKHNAETETRTEKKHIRLMARQAAENGQDKLALRRKRKLQAEEQKQKQNQKQKK